MSFVLVDVADAEESSEEDDPAFDPPATVATQKISSIRAQRRERCQRRHSDQHAASADLNLADVVIQAQFPPCCDPERNVAQMEEIAKEFNRHLTSRVVVGATARKGIRVPPGHFLLAHRNHRAEVVVGQGKRVVCRIQTGYTEAAVLGVYHHSTPLIGAFGSSIVTVPSGRFAKAWSGHHPLLLGAGVHVVHDPLFRLESEGDWLVEQSCDVVEHEDLHIVRVPRQSLARVIVESRGVLLHPREEPYVYDTPFFQLLGFVSANAPYVRVRSVHRIIVPGGFVARVWRGAVPLILEACGDAPYEFDDDTLAIHHPFHSADISNTQQDSPQQLDLVPATTKVIRHGNLCRIRPGLDGAPEVGVARTAGGEHQVIDRTATIVEPTSFIGFLPLGCQTLSIPSNAPFVVARTADSLRVNVRLLVAFEVADALQLLRCVTLAALACVVEELALSEVARVVQRSTSQSFLGAITHESNLAKCLSAIGIRLVRLGCERATVADADLEQPMAEAAALSAQLATELAVAEQRSQIRLADLRSEAAIAIENERARCERFVSAAVSELEAVKVESQAIVARATGIANELQMQGEALQRYPALLQERLLCLLCGAMENWVQLPALPPQTGCGTCDPLEFDEPAISITPQQLQTMMAAFVVA